MDQSPPPEAGNSHSGGITIRETHQAMKAIAQASGRGTHGILAVFYGMRPDAPRR